MWPKTLRNEIPQMEQTEIEGHWMTREQEQRGVWPQGEKCGQDRDKENPTNESIK